MALSNIFREPRREITESVVGVGVCVAALSADYLFSRWFIHLWWPEDESLFGVVFGMVAGAIAGAALLLLLDLTHELGDATCNALQRRGVHLRPRNRPQ